MFQSFCKQLLKSLKSNETGTKNLGILLNESWDFFARRWGVLFQATLFAWLPVLMVIPLASFLWETYKNLSKSNPELLFSFKVILAGGVLVFFIAGVFIFTVLLDKLIKTTLIASLWGKPDEKYSLDIVKLIKDVWPKMGELFKAQNLAWVIIFLGCLLLIAPGILFLIWFSFVPYEVILRGKFGKNALSSSKKIVRGNILKFAGNMLAIIGILVFINIGLSGFFNLIFSFSNSKDLMSVGELIATVISNILSLWATVFHLNLYYDMEKSYLSKNAVAEEKIQGSM